MLWKGVRRTSNLRISAMRVEPGKNAGPYCPMRLSADEEREVLQADAGLAGIFVKLAKSCRHCVDKGCNRLPRRDGVGGVGDRQHRQPQRRRSEKLVTDAQGSGAEPVFVVRPFEDLVNQSSGKGKFIQRPALDPGVDHQCSRISGAEDNIDEPRPQKGLRSRHDGEERQQRAGQDVDCG